MLMQEEFQTMLNNPVRELVGRVELYVYDEDSTLLQVCSGYDNLKSFTIERVGENKFFGYGICQKLNVRLLDTERKINISTSNYLEAVLGVDNEFVYPFPRFHVSRVNRDETTNELSITAYDILYDAVNHTYSELSVLSKYSIRGLVQGCADVLGIPVNIISDNPAFDNIVYETTANYTGTETIRQVLNHIAEATQTIYYVDRDYNLTFKDLDKDGEPVLTIGKDAYFSLNNRANKRLGKITSITGLNDNITASISSTGSTQYIRDNPLYTIRDDVGELLDDAIDRIGGLTINQFDLTWRGNWLLEIADKFEIVTKDNNTVDAYLLNDVITYDGTLSEHTQWQYDDNEGESEDNPTTIGEALKRTYAKVDKINQEITLFVGEKEEEIDTKLSEFKMTSDGISAKVEQNIINVDNQLDVFEQNINMVTEKVDASLSSSDVQLLISNTVQSGIQSVTTTTGFVFDEVGLTISKSDNEISTTITEDGMYVEKNNETLLTANNNGVEANNLKSNYIIISERCRFEKYGTDRVGCYWLGGE